MESNNSLYGAAIILLICSLIKNLFLNLFLASTTVFPFILILNSLGNISESSKAVENYQLILASMVSFLFHRTLDTVSTGQLLTLFFIVMYIISLIISGIKYVIKRYSGVAININMLHIFIFMTLIYAIATIFTYLHEPENLWFMGILTFYLFNIFSIFSYTKIIEETQKIRDQYPKLSKIPFL